MTPRHGFIVGKFYPPHAGHHLLVRTAARICERVTVAVLPSSAESIALESRLAWLRETHAGEPNVTFAGAIDDHPVDYQDPAIWDAHVAIMQRLLHAPVDVVFSSERYGDELARRLSAVHVCLDVDRRLAPMSGTEVRRDPRAAWPYLAPATRGGLCQRVVIVGAESTGKTTLARALAERLGTIHVEEHGRERAALELAELHARAKLSGEPRPAAEDIVWASEDFAEIAAEQARIEDAAARSGPWRIVADTDAFATSIWHERYLGSRSSAVEAIAAARHEGPRLYLLTHHDDVPFVQDGTRDGEAVRAWMTERFASRLEESGRRWAWIRGPREARLDAAIAEAQKLSWHFAPPLG